MTKRLAIKVSIQFFDSSATSDLPVTTFSVYFVHSAFRDFRWTQRYERPICQHLSKPFTLLWIWWRVIGGGAHSKRSPSERGGASVWSVNNHLLSSSWKRRKWEDKSMILTYRGRNHAMLPTNTTISGMTRKDNASPVMKAEIPTTGSPSDKRHGTPAEAKRLRTKKKMASGVPITMKGSTTCLSHDLFLTANPRYTVK